VGCVCEHELDVGQLFGICLCKLKDMSIVLKGEHIEVSLNSDSIGSVKLPFGVVGSLHCICECFLGMSMEV